MIKKIIQQPLFQFLLIGAGIFFIFYLVSDKKSRNEIVIDNAVINDLSAKWEMQWKRTPNSQELTKLIGLYINQEVLYREALEMNLDHNDEIIKRRMAKKMEFVSDELAESLQPTKKILLAYYNKNKQEYKKPAIYTFTQLFFKEYATAISAQISEDHSREELADPLSIPRKYESKNLLKISIDFGTAFAQSLDTLELNMWAGPIKSGYGNHLVYITKKEESGLHTYAEVADEVLLDYNFFASNEFRRELISTLLKNYELSFEIEDENLKTQLLEAY